MPINPDALGAEGSPVVSSWNSKDCLLYALGVGAGMDDPVGAELGFTTENSHEVTQKALPTMCVVLGDGMGRNPDNPMRHLGPFNPALLLHGEQTITLHRPLPVAATISTVARITGVYDKGRAAVVETTSSASDAADGQPVYTNVSTLVLRGEGGWGGDRGPSAPGTDRPDRSPDKVVSYTTRTDQALLYRLNGDRNPLHSDPAFAALAGFDRPILHRGAQGRVSDCVPVRSWLNVETTRRCGLRMTDRLRFDVALYTVADAARIVDVHPSTPATWAKGYQRSPRDGRPVVGPPIIAAAAVGRIGDRAAGGIGAS